MGGDIMALVGFWPLDGNTNDYSVNNNTGVNNNVTFVNGKIGQAGSFSSSSITVDLSYWERDFTSHISLSLWMYIPNTAT